jgi:integrase
MSAASITSKSRGPQRLLGELEITTGLRSGEIRGLTWDSIDLKGKRLFVETQATRRRADDKTKMGSSRRTHGRGGRADNAGAAGHGSCGQNG